jgi:hypothetical protein
MEAVVEQVVIGVWEEHQGSTVDVAEAVAVHQPGQQWPEFQRWWISGDGAGGCCRDQVGQLKGDVARVGGDGRTTRSGSTYSVPSLVTVALASGFRLELPAAVCSHEKSAFDLEE